MRCLCFASVAVVVCLTSVSSAMAAIDPVGSSLTTATNVRVPTNNTLDSDTDTDSQGAVILPLDSSVSSSFSSINGSIQSDATANATWSGPGEGSLTYEFVSNVEAINLNSPGTSSSYEWTYSFILDQPAELSFVAESVLQFNDNPSRVDQFIFFTIDGVRQEANGPTMRSLAIGAHTIGFDNFLGVGGGGSSTNVTRLSPGSVDWRITIVPEPASCLVFASMASVFLMPRRICSCR